MIRNILAVAAGALVAFCLIYLLESAGHLVHPLPAGVDPNNPDQLREHIKTLPAGAFALVLAAWLLATLVGGWVAARIGRNRNLALVVGALVLAGAVANMAMLPHPLWFVVVAVAGIVAASLLARCLVRTPTPAAGAVP
jgi:MFS family permease